MNSAPVYNHILIRVPNWLGDSMMATPVISAVHKAFPKTKLTILAKSHMASFWKSFSIVDEVLVLEGGLWGYFNTVGKIKKRKFDAALTLPSSFSSAFLLFLSEIPVRIGWEGEGKEIFLTHVIPTLNPRRKHLVWEYLELVHQGFKMSTALKTVQLTFPINYQVHQEAKTVLKSFGVNEKSELAALGPGATYGPAKRWPLDCWQQLILKMLDSGKETLVVLGGSEEKEYLKDLGKDLPKEYSKRLVSLVGKTNSQLLASVLRRCKFLITNDTGPMHVAAAVGTPTIALFGSTSPTWTRPFGLGHDIIYKAVECSPCFQKTCPIGYVCLNQISVDEVFKVVQKKRKGSRMVEGEKPPQGVLV